MLVRFVVSNFLSFKKETEFNMLAGTEQKHHKDHIYKRNSVDLLKTAALYGANGAGKSNLIKAINFLKRLVVEGGEDTLSQVNVFRLDEGLKEIPASFEIEFIDGQLAYIYGIKVKTNQILEEWLFISGLGGGEDELIFHRRFDNRHLKIEFSEKYYQDNDGKIVLDFIIENLVKSNVTLLYILSELKENFSDEKSVYKWFKNKLIPVFPDTKPGAALIAMISDSRELLEYVNNYIAAMETGMESIHIESSPFTEENTAGRIVYDKIKEDVVKHGMLEFKSRNDSSNMLAVLENDEIRIKRIVGNHKNEDGKNFGFFLHEESDGTNRLLELLPAFHRLLEPNVVLLIDEIDQSIHPILLKELISKIVSSGIICGQFIFTTHEANLLDQNIFRRDEIWFVEKDQGETKLYPLSDFDIRYDLDIRKGYLNGRFGAIPFMGDLQNLNWDQYAEAQ